MMPTLHIACLQTNLIWENAGANCQHLGAKIESIATDVDIIVLPEMFTTGFSMNPAPLAETMSGATVAWMTSMSKASNAVIAGSVIIQEKDKYFNRFLWVEPSGAIQYYDKRHLFTLAGEDDQYTAGNEVKIVDYQGWKINLNVCYDLRFPVWSRNTQHYDVSIYVANWPEPRAHAWSTLLRARAIENQSYIVGVNRIGQDVNSNKYNGQSAIIDMQGHYLAEAKEQDVILYAELDKENLTQFRESYPFYKDRDQFELK